MPFSPTDFYQTHLADIHQRLLANVIVRTYLSGAQIRLDGSALLPEDRFNLPFGTFSTVEFAHLFSVFNGSRVHVQAEKSTSRDDAPPGLYFSVINNHVLENQHKNKLGIVQRADTDTVDLFVQDMHIDHYFLKEERTPAKLGTFAFALCAITAHLAGMGRITLIAADGRGKSPRYVGVKVWPTLGFDAPLLADETSGFPHLDGSHTVQDVIARDEAWWAEHGTQRRMAFDLSAHSVSWLKLLTYTGRKLSEGSPS